MLRRGLVLGVLLLSGGVSAQKDRIRELGMQAAQLRNLSYKPVKAQAVSQKECVAYLMKLLDEEMQPAQTNRREGFLKLLGLMPEQGSLKKIYAELYGDQVRGLYDPKQKRYLVVTSAKGQEDPMAAALGLNLDDILTVHELGHAIQDQHFGLGALTKQVAENFDQELAASSLFEGDASVLMLAFALKATGLEGVDTSALGGLDSEQMMMGQSAAVARAPRFFRDVLGFPYGQGMKFVSSIKRGQNWAAVDRAFGQLPESTEQIIHPEKYLRDHPKPVRMEAARPGTSLGQDTAGEFTIRCWARENGFGDEAAAGWGGDRYEVFRTSSGLAGIWVTTWDSDKDAVEFEKLARQATAKKPSNQVERSGRGVTVRFL
ncbi:MAG: hypothetical protein KF760_17005 [Candidatus Eremiobacteraeota bacterium]|nr:hypothetical protein [Candidatus Eremiobacteraeota bacterium]MCW5870138.1 hypothetical protein [Candidatus Eremiobacteraeota bacterium]